MSVSYTHLDVYKRQETIELMKRWGADAIRDCDGTEFPEELTKTGAKIYATYYTTRKDVYKRQEIITPDRVFYKGETDFLEFNTQNGEIGVYKNHIPLTTCLLYTSEVIM